MKEKIKQILNSDKFGEFIRFCIVGLIATGLHYGIYLLLLWVAGGKGNQLYDNIAYSIGYALSFVCNLFLTSRFTFKEKLTVAKGGGFALSHAVNYGLHILFLNFFIWVGSPHTWSSAGFESVRNFLSVLPPAEKWAPIPTYIIVFPINFLLVRTVFKKFK